MFPRFSSIARQRPFLLRDIGNGLTEVLLGPRTKSFGSFKTEHKELVAPGFVLGPNPRSEAEELVVNPMLVDVNPEFGSALASVLKKNVHLDQVYQDLAAGETKTRFFHIYDFRQPPIYGRIPDVQDILGTVELDIGAKNTSIVPESFEFNTMYRPLTLYGATLLSNHMFDLLRQSLEPPVK